MALKKFIALLLLLALQICLASATFNYTDQTNWGSSCNNLGYQSPIDIPCEQFLTVCPPAKSYQIYWKEPMMQFGASPFEDLKTFFTNNSWVRFSNETNDYIFKSWQFHLHQNSEHTVNGRSYPLEMHVVHKLDHPTIVQYLVVGVFFEVDHTLAYDIFDAVKVDSNTSFNHLFPFALTNKPAYHYRGSLTTPPCTEAVNWFVQTEPIMIRQETLDRLEPEIGGEETNNRFTHRLGDRTVYVVGQGC